MVKSYSKGSNRGSHVSDYLIEISWLHHLIEKLWKKSAFSVGCLFSKNDWLARGANTLLHSKRRGLARSAPITYYFRFKNINDLLMNADIHNCSPPSLSLFICKKGKNTSQSAM